MSIQLKLDAAAMQILFPEGSEVRLELQQAVINETVRKLVDRELKNTRHLIETQCKAELQRQLVADGKLTPSNWNPDLPETFKTRIKAVAQEATNSAVFLAVSEALKPHLTEMDAKIKRALDYGLQARMDGMAKDALRGALK